MGSPASGVADFQGKALQPGDPSAFSWHGDFLVDQRRFDEARAAYKQAQAVGPRWLEPIAFLGNVHYFTGHPDLAAVEHQRVLDSEPNYGLGNLYLGRAYLALGQTEPAVAQLRKANELLGVIPMSEADLAYALAVGGKRADAEATLARMLVNRTRRAGARTNRERAVSLRLVVVFQTPDSMSSAPVLSPICSTGTPTFSSIAV